MYLCGDARHSTATRARHSRRPDDHAWILWRRTHAIGHCSIGRLLRHGRGTGITCRAVFHGCGYFAGNPWHNTRRRSRDTPDRGRNLTMTSPAPSALVLEAPRTLAFEPLE